MTDARKKHWFDTPGHPLWLLIRWGVVLITLVVFLTFGYANGWSAKDINTVIGTLGALGAFDVFKKLITASGPDLPLDPDIDTDQENQS